MIAKQIMESEDFKRCKEFHGHVCPGLSIGYRAVKAGMTALNENRAIDEELVAIVETDACAVDAVQVLTGCTFGKGNFIYKDYGKMAITLMSRNTGLGVRVSLLPNAFSINNEHRELMKKVMSGESSQQETKRFTELHLERSYDILEKPVEQLFAVQSIQIQLPPKATIEPSIACECCGETAMSSKLSIIDNKKICRGCIEKNNK